MENKKPQDLNILPIPLEAGMHYTVYAGSDSAMTVRREIRMIDVLPAPEFRPAYANSTRGKWRLGTYKEGRKRATFYLDVTAAGTLIVPGIHHGVLADNEKWSSYAISATMNLAATPDRIREIVEFNINPNFTAHDIIVAFPSPLNRATGDEGILVYPDAPTQHAVILGMRENLTREDA